MLFSELDNHEIVYDRVCAPIGLSNSLNESSIVSRYLGCFKKNNIFLETIDFYHWIYNTNIYKTFGISLWSSKHEPLEEDNYVYGIVLTGIAQNKVGFICPFEAKEYYYIIIDVRNKTTNNKLKMSRFLELLYSYSPKIFYCVLSNFYNTKALIKIEYVHAKFSEYEFRKEISKIKNN